MESEYLSLCNYDIYVSAKLYEKYYNAIKDAFLRLKQKTIDQNFSPNSSNFEEMLF